jgi:hypothetical protein
MDGRELVIEVDIVEGQSVNEFNEIVFVNYGVGESSNLNYIKACHDLRCFKNDVYLIINKGKDNQIKLCTDLYVDREGSFWVKARDITQAYETNRTRNLCTMERIVASNKQNLD